MTINEYQVESHKTAICPRIFVEDIDGNLNECGLLYPALGLAGEAGEAANKIKKIARDNYGIITEDMRKIVRKEIGDCGWYLAELATRLGESLESILCDNYLKLKDRQERGVLTGSGDER